MLPGTKKYETNYLCFVFIDVLGENSGCLADFFYDFKLDIDIDINACNLINKHAEGLAGCQKVDCNLP